MSNANPHPAHVDAPPLDRLDQLVWVGDIPALGVKHCPDQIAIICPERNASVSYQDLDRRADAFVAVMRAHGLNAGSRIAYLGRNSDLYFPVLFGAIRGGYVLVPLNWRLTAPEIAFQLEDSQSNLLICDPELRETAVLATARLKNPPPLLATEADGDDPGLRKLLSNPAVHCPSPRDDNQVILQIYTSGTTGNPKGVLISHGALTLARHGELISPDFAHLDQACVILSAMPNFHMGGMSWVIMGLLRLGTVIITADATPANMLKLIREYDAQHSFIVPTVIRAILDDLRASGTSAPRMRGIWYGAMAMGESLLAETMAAFNCALVQFFGMTENTGSATYLAPSDHDPARPHLLKSVGKPYPGMSIEIRGPNRELLSRGQHGEIWVKSPTRMLGYWNLPEKTAEALVDGWYASGDGGYLDAEGYLFITDRIKDMIVSGGENIYPIEVEEALRQHPAVLDAAVIGLPDPRWGETVAAAIELRPGAQLGEEELLSFARERIAGFKCPRLIRFVPTLPRTASGKVQRAALRQKLRDK